MGNCISANSLPIDNALAIRVVQAADGVVVDIELPPISQEGMKVGELMLQFPPGHFVTDFQQLEPGAAGTAGKRATPLGADLDVQAGAVYVLLPMSRLHSRISPQELLAFAHTLGPHDDRFSHDAKKPATKGSIKAGSASLIRPPKFRGLFTAGVRVAPLSVDDQNLILPASCPLETLQHDQEVSALVSSSSSSMLQVRVPQFQANICKSKPWAPKLETIQELIST